ncbi:MAG TPA: RNA polymerase subunit sigma-70 [Cryomorphaceae bacterium]|nr:RNA polymerase subunit sigma-70 [Cryomorphaceae bacterium]
MPLTLKEVELISLIRSEKTRLKGYAIIADTYQERLYWHVRSMVGSHDNANDVLQNTFIKVWKGLSGFRGDSKLYTWLYRIASNEAVSFIQKEKRRFGSSDEESIFVQKLNSDPYFDGDEMIRILWEAIDRLPDKQREVFKLKYFEEMKYEEMSELLGTSIGALKASYHHAVQKVKEFLSK